MAEQSTCKGCGAPLIWAITEHGKRIPLNQPEKRFILVLVQPDNDPDLSYSYYEARMRETYTSHFATCPKADEFRKEKKG